MEQVKLLVSILALFLSKELSMKHEETSSALLNALNQLTQAARAILATQDLPEGDILIIDRERRFTVRIAENGGVIYSSAVPLDLFEQIATHLDYYRDLHSPKPLMILSPPYDPVRGKTCTACNGTGRVS